MLDLARIARRLAPARRRGRGGRADARRSPPRRLERLRAGDRHLVQHPRLRRTGGARRRLRQRRDAGDGRREPRRRGRVVRCRDLARRPDLLPRPAARARRDASRAARPGGRVSAIVYSTPERNQFFSIPVSIIRRRAGLPAPAPGLPGPFSLGATRSARGGLRGAGFHEAEVRAVDAPVRFSSAADCVRFERESFGALHAMLAGVTGGRATGGLGGDRGRATPVRRPGRLRRPVRAPGRSGDEIEPGRGRRPWIGGPDLDSLSYPLCGWS